MSGENDGCEIMNEECMREFRESRKERSEIKQALDHITKRLFHSNGERAMVELIRDNAMELQRHKQEHERTDSGKFAPVQEKEPAMRTRKINMFKGIVSAENYSATDIIKIAAATVICLLLSGVIMKLFHLQTLLNQ